MNFTNPLLSRFTLTLVVAFNDANSGTSSPRCNVGVAASNIEKEYFHAHFQDHVVVDVDVSTHCVTSH